MRLRHTAIAVAITALTLAACSSNDSDQDDAPAPDYKIVQQDTSGNQRLVTVEVDTTNDLRAVFDDVTKALTDEAGYIISINCSTGGNENYEHRLANGKYAVGRMGAATTGLDEGDTEFEPVKGRSCPAKS
jgi:ABC-type glycerol-3-phosphate transport system substrate-binding protein